MTLRALRGLALTLLLVAVCAAAVGWLYTLRDVRALAAGPTLHDALPLQRLAGQGDQPLLRVAAAWLPAGVVAGIALGTWSGLRPAARALAAGAAALVVCFAAGAVSDTVTASDPLAPHIAPQLGRAALWIAAALMAAGALAGPRSRSRAR